MLACQRADAAARRERRAHRAARGRTAARSRARLRAGRDRPADRGGTQDGRRLTNGKNLRTDSRPRTDHTPRCGGGGRGVRHPVRVGAVIIRSFMVSQTSGPPSGIADVLGDHVVFVPAYLIPFAGIAFLWFIGVVRDRIGVYEDRFFATVFLGSGIVFVAMLFSAVGADRAADDEPTDHRDAELGESIARAMFYMYGARSAGVFTIVTSTIVLRTERFPDGRRSPARCRSRAAPERAVVRHGHPALPRMGPAPEPDHPGAEACGPNVMVVGHCGRPCNALAGCRITLESSGRVSRSASTTCLAGKRLRLWARRRFVRFGATYRAASTTG